MSTGATVGQLSGSRSAMRFSTSSRWSPSSLSVFGSIGHDLISYVESRVALGCETENVPGDLRRRRAFGHILQAMHWHLSPARLIACAPCRGVFTPKSRAMPPRRRRKLPLRSSMLHGRVRVCPQLLGTHLPVVARSAARIEQSHPSADTPLSPTGQPCHLCQVADDLNQRLSFRDYSDGRSFARPHAGREPSDHRIGARFHG